MPKFHKEPCPFGQVVVEARKERGMSRYRLAKIMGRKPQQLAAIEQGKSEPRFSTILHIARALGMDPAELFRRAADRSPLPPLAESTPPPKKRAKEHPL